MFYAALLVIGCAGAAWLLHSLILQDWRVNYEFVERDCVVLDRRLPTFRGESGLLYRPEVKIRYTVDGDAHTAWTYDIATARDARESFVPDRASAKAAYERFVVGERYPCWYDPSSPDVVVLVREPRWWIWLAMIVPGLLIVIGGGGLVYGAITWGKSTERRAALGQWRPPVPGGPNGRTDSFATSGRTDAAFPNVPTGVDITNSPGTRLAYRLPVGTSPGWALLGLTAICMVWNGTVAVFGTIVVRGHLISRPDWFATLFLVPFALIGLILIGLLVRQLRRTTGIGPTRMEISDHPVRPGERYELFFSQSGKLRVKSMQVLLVCEERATYRQGTDTRTERREVRRHRLFRREGFQVLSAAPFEAMFDLRIPADAMHSFISAHHAVQWRLVVRARLHGWPRMRRDFPLVVLPVADNAVGNAQSGQQAETVRSAGGAEGAGGTGGDPPRSLTSQRNDNRNGARQNRVDAGSNGDRRDNGSPQAVTHAQVGIHKEGN